MAGRPPKPTALKLVRGNPGRHPLNLQEPTPALGLPEFPSDVLPEEVRPHWERLGAQAMKMRVMTEADGDALAWLAYLTYLAATAAKAGKPSIGVLKELRSHRTEFGMSPSARVRVKVAEPSKKESNVARFLRPA